MASKKCPKDGKDHSWNEIGSQNKGRKVIIEYICTKCGETTKDVK